MDVFGLGFGLILMGDVYIENLLTINKEKKDKNVSAEIVYVSVLNKSRVWLIFLEEKETHTHNKKKEQSSGIFQTQLGNVRKKSKDKAYIVK